MLKPQILFQWPGIINAAFPILVPPLLWSEFFFLFTFPKSPLLLLCFKDGGQDRGDSGAHREPVRAAVGGAGRLRDQHPRRRGKVPRTGRRQNATPLWYGTKGRRVSFPVWLKPTRLLFTCCLFGRRRVSWRPALIVWLLTAYVA